MHGRYNDAVSGLTLSLLFDIYILTVNILLHPYIDPLIHHLFFKMTETTKIIISLSSCRFARTIIPSTLLSHRKHIKSSYVGEPPTLTFMFHLSIDSSLILPVHHSFGALLFDNSNLRHDYHSYHFLSLPDEW